MEIFTLSIALFSAILNLLVLCLLFRTYKQLGDRTKDKKSLSSEVKNTIEPNKERVNNGKDNGSPLNEQNTMNEEKIPEAIPSERKDDRESKNDNSIDFNQEVCNKEKPFEETTKNNLPNEQNEQELIKVKQELEKTKAKLCEVGQKLKEKDAELIKVEEDLKAIKSQRDQFNNQLGEKKKQIFILQEGQGNSKNVSKGGINSQIDKLKKKNDELERELDTVRSDVKKEAEIEIAKIREQEQQRFKEIQGRVEEEQKKAENYAKLIRGISGNDDAGWFILKNRIDVYRSAANKFSEVYRRCSDISSDEYYKEDLDELQRTISDIMQISVEVLNKIENAEGE